MSAGKEIGKCVAGSCLLVFQWELGIRKEKYIVIPIFCQAQLPASFPHPFSLLALMGVHHHGSKSSLGFHRSTSVAKFVRHLQSARMLQSFSWDGGSEDRMTDSVIPSAFPCSICCVGMREDLVFFHLQHVLCLTHVLGSTVA